jgi:hypothetical protein
MLKDDDRVAFGKPALGGAYPLELGLVDGRNPIFGWDAKP